MATVADRLMCGDSVGDPEVLYRSIRLDYVHVDGEKWRLSSQAFNDPELKPSVDRKILRNDPAETRRFPSDAVAQLVAVQVRGISEIIQNPGASPAAQVTHKVDVIPRPIAQGNADGLAPNPAHAQVEVAPAFATKTRFNKLKDALCRIAEAHDWALAPVTPHIE